VCTGQVDLFSWTLLRRHHIFSRPLFSIQNIIHPYQALIIYWYYQYGDVCRGMRMYVSNKCRCSSEQKNMDYKEHPPHAFIWFRPPCIFGASQNRVGDLETLASTVFYLLGLHKTRPPCTAWRQLELNRIPAAVWNVGTKGVGANNQNPRTIVPGRKESHATYTPIALVSNPESTMRIESHFASQEPHRVSDR
jgi:hypothetical protein